MPKSANQKLKILYLKKILLEKTDEEHGLSLAEIIKELERYGIAAERKSLYNDFEALRTFGMDIVQRKENAKTEYFVAGRQFELPELKLLVDAVQSSKFITKKKSTELIRKIEGFASTHQAKQLQRQVYVDNRIKSMNESIYYTVDTIHTANQNNRKISFQYFEWNERKEKIPRHHGKRYLVSPWDLMWDDENYYLIAYDSENEKIKHYRVDKMLSAEVSEEKREGKETFLNFDPGEYSKKHFGMFGGREESVKLRCKNHMAGIIIDKFGTEIPFLHPDSEHFEFTAKVAVCHLFFGWLISFGNEIQILSPQNVIDDYLKFIEEACHHPQS